MLAKGTDGDRFKAVTEQLIGKRLTLKELTEKLQDDDKLSMLANATFYGREKRGK